MGLTRFRKVHLGEESDTGKRHTGLRLSNALVDGNWVCFNKVAFGKFSWPICGN